MPYGHVVLATATAGAATKLVLHSGQSMLSMTTGKGKSKYLRKFDYLETRNLHISEVKNNPF